jgi:lipopolysaccharide/colanic/teichoic acid biosynthesis glycosyltransferase
MKRLIDFGIALILLILTFPLLIGVALVVRLDSPGPIIFRQRRIGRSGQHFFILKFRSMVSNAESQGPYHTATNDLRVTRSGRWLRRTSVDELPQLLNVLKGEMSLVGPRPDVPQQRDLYTEDEWNRRLRVRPGITGLAQATLRSNATLEQRKQLDLSYADSPSVIWDAKILLCTVLQVFGRGGY